MTSKIQRDDTYVTLPVGSVLNEELRRKSAARRLFDWLFGIDQIPERKVKINRRVPEDAKGDLAETMRRLDDAQE